MSSLEIGFNDLKDSKDQEAFKNIQKLLFKKLSSPFVIDFKIKKELLAIILTIQNCYAEEVNKNFNLHVKDVLLK
jgi:hypothetical protein